MRYIGIDYGSKKVGVAISDEEGRMAFPDCVIPNNDALIPYIVGRAKELNALVVLGDSRDMKGNENPIAQHIRAFGEALSREGIGTAYEPEWFTSKEAERIQGRTPMTDAAAATLILNSYLSRNKTT